MSLMDIVKRLEGKTRDERRTEVRDILSHEGLDWVTHQYSTGVNVFVPSSKLLEVGVSGHFDAVPGSPGANDNASAVSVVISVLKHFKSNPLEEIGVRGLFFDEEEMGLKGSKAYASSNVLRRDGQKLVGVFNLELVGGFNAEYFALWPAGHGLKGGLLEAFERSARNAGHSCYRFDSPIVHSSDHQSFREIGIKPQNSFTITAISGDDKNTARKYLRAIERGESALKAQEILTLSDLFKHYHKESDKSEHLSETTLVNTTQSVIGAIRLIDKNIHTYMAG